MISGRVLGSQKVRAKLAAVRAEVPDLLNRDRLASFLIRRMQDNFGKQADPNGTPWPKHSPKTRPGPILKKSGSLRKSIARIDGNPRGIFASATGAGFRIGITSITHFEVYKRGGGRTVDTAEYGPLHQQGKGIPKRRFIGLGPTDQKAIADLLRREMRKAVGN